MEGWGSITNTLTFLTPCSRKGRAHVLFFTTRTPAASAGTFKQVIKNRQLHLRITQHTTSSSLPHTAAATAQLINMQRCAGPTTRSTLAPPKVCAPFLTHFHRIMPNKGEIKGKQAAERGGEQDVTKRRRGRQGNGNFGGRGT